jgi:hypothetical protein
MATKLGTKLSSTISVRAGSDRLRKRNGETRDAMYKRWWRAEAESAKRFVLKITKIVESFD